MALTLEAANRVRQKTLAFSRNSGVYRELYALFLHLAANKGNPDLQYVNLDGTSVSSDGGNADQVAISGASNLFAIYMIQRGTTTTWVQFADAATTAKNGTDDLSDAFKNATTKEERLYTYPVGRTLATGLAYSGTTTATGGTRNVKANRVDGFVIISAGLGN